jgi:hypothetical protein
MPKRANAGTVPASSSTIKAMSTFGHFHLRCKSGNLSLAIVSVEVLGQPRGGDGTGRTRRLTKRREVECRSLCCCCRRKSTSSWSLKLHIEEVGGGFVEGRHLVLWRSASRQPAQPANRQWQRRGGSEHTCSAYVQVDLPLPGQSQRPVASGRLGIFSLGPKGAP